MNANDTSTSCAAKSAPTMVELYLLGGRRLTFTMRGRGLELLKTASRTPGV